MEHGSAVGEAGVSADKRVYADAFFECMVGPDTLDHHDAALQPVEGPGMEHDRTSGIAEPDALTIANAKPG